MTEKSVIHWFRRDLRLDDNLGLHEALRSGRSVLPLFIFDPSILNSPRTGAPRLKFMLKALQSLDSSLRKHGTSLYIRHGNPVEIIPQIVEETDAEALYFNRDYSPFARKRDQHVAETLSIPVHNFDDALLMPPGSVMKSDGAPYTVFTPFKNRWNERPKPEISSFSLDKGSFFAEDGLENEKMPDLSSLGFDSTIDVPEASENIAQERLQVFITDDLCRYGDARNVLVSHPFAEKRPQGPSYLSPYLRLGLLSPRQTYWAAHEAYQRAQNKAARESIETWVGELTWREFYMHIMVHFPHVDRHNFRREYDALQWRNIPEDLQAWKDGKTGYPIVDAAMRQLKAIGWIPNRARMIVASFLTKDLLINWQEGEQHFMQWLIDGDPAANNGGWQWAAGTGTDAQPYFRIFNPVSQSEKFDPDGSYIRTWIPELQDIPHKWIHAPWEMASPPESYPSPIVNHVEARARALATFRAIREE